MPIALHAKYPPPEILSAPPELERLVMAHLASSGRGWSTTRSSIREWFIRERIRKWTVFLAEDHVVSCLHGIPRIGRRFESPGDQREERSTMATKYPEIFAALAAPIHEGFVRIRKHDGARYITARVVMNVLDTVLGPEQWNATYERWGDDAILCHLSITLPDGTVLTKCDVGSLTSMSDKNKQVDAGDDEKGGVSDALKRAAVLFGVGRFLYNDGVPGYADLGGEAPNDPAAPSPPQRRESKWGGARPEPGHVPASNGPSHGDRPPTTGRQLYAWIRKQEETRPDFPLLKSVNHWAKENELGGKMTEWDDSEIPGAYAAALYFLDQAEVPAN